jgi:hypothetical protein
MRDYCEPYYEEEYKDYTIHICCDRDYDDDPRGWSNVGTMVCWHSRYTLGDVQPKVDPITYLEELLGYYDDSPNLSMNELLDKAAKDYIILPLYLYDHSGISISTSHEYPFNDRWDAGQVGFILCSHKDAVKEWGKKKYTAQVAIKALKYLIGEVVTYNDYLTGNTFGYQIFEPGDDPQDGNSIDSCWGYYPDHDGSKDYQSALNEARDSVDYHCKQKSMLEWQRAELLQACYD